MTNRQGNFMRIIASIETSMGEFTTQEITEWSDRVWKGFSSSHVVQMLNLLIQKGLVQRNRHGKYAFAMHLMVEFLQCQTEQGM